MAKKDERSQLLDFIEPYLDEWRESSGNDDRAFRDWAVAQVLWDYDLSADQIADVTAIDAPRDRGIDGWYYAVEDEPPTLHVIQAKNTRTKVDDLLKMRNGLLSLFDERAVHANADAKGRASDLRRAFDDNTEVEFHLVTSHFATTSLRDDAAALVEPIGLFERQLPSRMVVHDLRDLVRELRVVRNDPIDTEFTVPASHTFEMSTASNYKTVAAAIPALSLAQLFREHRTNLFRLNPRYYLSSRGSVNKGMLQTLRSQERRDFYLYNNGITAVCGGVSVSQNGGDKVIATRDFQIVNGCQTTATLHEAWERGLGDEELAGVTVLVRIIEAPQSIAPLIMSRTNTQNPMKAEDERANDQRQIRLKGEFDKLTPPWFYEHKRGIWVANHPYKSDRQHYARGDGGYRHIAMKDLAQACLAFLGSPSGSIEGPRFVFQSAERYDRVFPERALASQLLFPYVLHELASRHVAAEGEGIVGATYLRYPLVAGVSRVIHDWLGVPEPQYLSPSASQALIDSAEEWAPEVLRFVFEELLADAKKSEAGIRSLVRRSDWLEEPVERALAALRRELARDADYATRVKEDVGSLGLRAKFPFPIQGA